MSKVAYSKRPYATINGVRIRQLYNQRILEYRSRCKGTQGRGLTGTPIGALAGEWDQWVRWTRAWEDALLATRDKLVDEAVQRERRKSNERKRDHGKRAPRGN